ncbi:MAG: hypothetical protein M1838_002016 [Thelocarpon superellum]|nr:MAG: hypothetical protein M1838_002016 [Thelocarpon superellum]
MARTARREATDLARTTMFTLVLSLSMAPLAQATLYDPKTFNLTNVLANQGVGYNFACRSRINAALGGADPFSQAGMNAATTLITLIPTLLTIGNLYVPRSSEAFGTSWVVGLMSAAFGLGLPVKSIGAVPQKQIIDLHHLPSIDVERIREYGKAVEGAIKTWDWPSWQVPLAELQGWYLGQSGNFVGGVIVNRAQQFRVLKARAHRYIWRNHWWYLPSIAISIVQLFLFYIMLSSTAGVTTSQPLWSCQSEINLVDSPQVGTTIWWLLASAGFAMLLRALQWCLSNHEMVYIHHLPHLSQFRALIEDPKAVTTAQELPPRYHPFRPAESITQTALLLWARIVYICKHPLLAVKATQGRRKPLVIMVHQSLEARGPLATVMTGFIQGATLLLLTAFFSVYWGGTVIDTLIMLVVLLVVVTAGRMLGLLYIRWSAHAYGFTMIECYDHDEIRGVMRLLASMPDVMVQINGAQYLWGTRVDGNKEFRRWLVAVERGEFDDDLRLGGHKEPVQPNAEAKGTSSSVNELRKSDEAMTTHSTAPSTAHSLPTSHHEAMPQTTGIDDGDSAIHPAPLRHYPTDLSGAVSPAHPAPHAAGTWPLRSHGQSAVRRDSDRSS